MAKADLGIKRVCPSCAARFYDLQKRPIECPKCAYTFEPESLLRQRRLRVPEPVQKVEPVVDEEAEDTEAEELEDESTEETEDEEAAVVEETPLETGADEDEETAAESDNVGVSVTEGEETEEDEDFPDEEIEDDEEDEEDEELKHRLPHVEEGELLKFRSIAPEQHFTEPPPRFNEATLVKELEKHGIGRPSTYAAIIERIQEREYVDRDRENRLRATRLGETVCDLLTTHFTAFVDLGFTAGMEEDLDAVAEGRADWREVLAKFWSTFEPLVAEKSTSIGAGEYRSRPSEEMCSQGHPMEERLGRFGWYLACSLYPEHSERKSLSKVIGDDTPGGDVPVLEGAGLPCPQCGAEHGGKLAQRRSRFGYFLGCDRYPECRFIPKPEVPEEFGLTFDAPCPVCGSEHGGKLQPKRNSKRNTYFYSCDRYPECKTIRPRPTGATHADCGAVIGKVMAQTLGAQVGDGRGVGDLGGEGVVERRLDARAQQQYTDAKEERAIRQRRHAQRIGRPCLEQR